MIRLRPVPHACRAAVFAIGFALAAAGCGQAPLAPQLEPGSGSGDRAPMVLAIGSDGSTYYTQAPEADGLGSSSASLETSVEIQGSKGGVLRCGRFEMTVPPGAFHGVGTLHMAMPDSTLMVVRVALTPASLNALDSSVDLAVHLEGTDAAAEGLCVYSYEPERSAWLGTTPTLEEPVTVKPSTGSSAQVASGKVGWRKIRVPLNRLTVHAAGKVGWKSKSGW